MNLYEQLIRIAYSQIPCMLLNGMSTPVLLLMCSTDYDDKLILMLGFLKSLNARSHFIICKPALASPLKIDILKWVIKTAKAATQTDALTIFPLLAGALFMSGQPARE